MVKTNNEITDNTFHTIFEQSPISTQIFSPDGKILQVNKAWETLWGVKLSQMQDFNILHDKQLVRTEIIKYIREGFAGKIVKVPAHKYVPQKTVKESTAPVRWVQNYIYPIKDNSGKVIQVVMQHEDITEQMVGQEKLQESEEQFKIFANNIQNLAWMAKPDGWIYWYNKQWYEYTGTTYEEMQGWGWDKVHHPEHRKRVIEFVKTAWGKGETFELTFPLKGADGKYQWFLTRAYAVKDEKGKVLRWIGTNTNINELKEAQAAFKESEARKTAFFETALDAIITMDDKGRVIEFNPAAELIFGYSRKEALGKEMASLIIPHEFQDMHRKGLAHYLKTGEGKLLNNRIEIIAMRKDKSIFPVELTITRVPSASSPLFTGTIQDITKRKQMEERQNFLERASIILSESIEYEATLKNLGNLIIPCLADYCRIFVVNENKQIKEITVKHTNPNNLPLVKKLYNEYKDDPGNEASVERLLETGRAELMNKMTPDVLKNSSLKVIKLVKELNLQSYMGVPMRIGNKVVGAITFSSTRNDRIYTKEDLAVAEELARRAALAIENAHLYTEAQKAITLRDEFISVASHELKTPVTSLKMYTQVMKSKLEREGNDISTHPLAKMDEQINKLTGLIEDLLNVSKVQAGKLEFKEEAFNLDNIVKEVIDDVQPTMLKHKIILKGTIKKNVFGDKDRIVQVITNLITNATKYSPNANKVLIHLSPEKDVAVVTVQDFGIGIDKEHQKRIFERFYRVNSVEERTFPGLGLGLYISYQIIQRHGGEMSVVSTKGKGSQFSFTLPYKPKAGARVGVSNANKKGIYE